MSIIKMVREADSYTRIPNQTARDENLKAESLGVIVFISSWPDNWTVRETLVRKRFNWGKRKMRSIWDNLEEFGYVQRLHRQRTARGRLVTTTHLAVTPHFLPDATLADDTKCDTGESATYSTEHGRTTTIKRKNKKNRSNKYIKKQTSAKGGEKPSISINTAENIIGVKFTKTISQLGDPSRIISIIFKSKLEPEQIRILFSQFDDYCSNSDIKDRWALLIDFVKRASKNKLHLTSNAEASLTPWV